MHPPIDVDPYKEAIITGFLTYEPPKEISDPTACLVTPDDYRFSSLAELDAEIFLRHFGEQDWALSDIDTYIIYEAFPGTVIDVALPKLAPPLLVVPNIGTLSASLVNSDDKLFSISHASQGSSSREWSLV